MLAVGEFGQFFLPKAFLTNLFDGAFTRCSTPSLPFAFGPLTPVPGGLAIPIRAVTPGRCTVTINSHDENGNVFRDTSTITIVP